MLHVCLYPLLFTAHKTTEFAACAGTFLDASTLLISLEEIFFQSCGPMAAEPQGASTSCNFQQNVRNVANLARGLSPQYQTFILSKWELATA